MIKEFIRSWLNDDSDVKAEHKPTPAKSPMTTIMDNHGSFFLSLNLYKASGGTIVTVSNESRIRGMGETSPPQTIYVVSEGKDLVEELGEILTIEGLKG